MKRSHRRKSRRSRRTRKRRGGDTNKHAAEFRTCMADGKGLRQCMSALKKAEKKAKNLSYAAMQKKADKAAVKAVDEKGRKYYYNEAGESTWDSKDEVCHPKDGIEKTGNISGDCIGARYKGGEEYWYHPTKQFSTHNKNHPLCHSVEGIYKTGVDSDMPLTPGFKVNKSVTQKPQPQESKKVEEEKKSNVECSELSNTRCKKSDNCELVTKKRKGKANNKKNKVKKCLPKKKGGKRTKRKKSRKKRKKSRKRRR